MDLPNDRSIYLFTNIDETIEPLIVTVPQWAKASLDKMPKARQEQIYDQFSEDISVAFEKLLREVP
jgi:hypothetical protein